MIYSDVTATVGKTPMVELKRLGPGLSPEGAGTMIVALLSDTGKVYITSTLFSAAPGDERTR